MTLFEGEGNTEMSEKEQMMENIDAKLAKFVYQNYITQQENAKSNRGLTADKNSIRNKWV